MKLLQVNAPGQGDTAALLVPGNDLCGEFYLPLATHLAAGGLAVSLVTLPGFHGEAADEDPGWDRFADAICTELGQLPQRRKVLIGHSMGGLLALLAAAKQPPGLIELVLIEPTLFPYRFMARAGRRLYLRRVVRADRHVFHNSAGIAPRIHDLASYPREKIDLYLEVRRTSDVATTTALFQTLPDSYPLPFDRVDVPILYLSGANIGVRGRLVGWLARRRLRGVTHRVIPNAAHWIVNEQDPALAACIAEALAR